MTGTVTVTRHGESELSEQGIVNGDPGTPCGLSATGRAQARTLGIHLAGDQVSLAVTSTFPRAVETADLALAGRTVSRLVLPELDDLRFGEFEGRTLDEYRRWSSLHGIATRPEGQGESRLDAVRRYCAGLRSVLARPEAGHILVVGHGLPLAYVVRAAGRGSLTDRVDPLEPGTPYRIGADDLRDAVVRLESWAEGYAA